jgi:IS5 family transposase
LAVIAAPANENEKKHAPKLLDMAVKALNSQTKVLVANAQYSSKRLRKNMTDHGIKPIITYPSNQPGRSSYALTDVSKPMGLNG